MTGSGEIGLADCADRTLSLAKAASATLVLIDDLCHEVLANLSGTLLVDDMSDILVSEGLEG